MTTDIEKIKLSEKVATTSRAAQKFYNKKIYMAIINDSARYEFLIAKHLKDIASYVYKYNMYSFCVPNSLSIIKGILLNPESLPYNSHLANYVYIITTDGSSYEIVVDIQAAVDFIENEITTFNNDIEDFIVVEGLELELRKTILFCELIQRNKKS